MLANYHTHTVFSDGRGEPAAFVEHALKRSFSHLGFSEHAPVSFDNAWSLKWEDADRYTETIEGLKAEYKGKIGIYRALEIDYIPGISLPFSDLKKRFRLDYTIGGVHLVKHPFVDKLWFIDGAEKEEYSMGLEEVFDNDVRSAVTHYYDQQIEMIEQHHPDIVAHFDKIKMHNKGKYFDGDEPWIIALQERLMDVFRKHNTIVEINTRGLYKGRYDEFYPSDKLICECISKGIPLMLSSDAHTPEEIDGWFGESLHILKNIGVRELMIFDHGTFRPVPINLFGSQEQ